MTRASNLLFFLSDNHARSASGCYGNPAVRTPTLDAIAAAGVRFDAAYSTSPICCPARASIATGRYPHQTGYWDNAIVYDGKVRSWMHRLRDAGYDVVSIGKLHFRSTEDDNGFTEEIVPMHILNGKGGVAMLLRWSNEEPVNVGQWQLYLEKSTIGETHYQHYDIDISDRAIAWLEARAAKTGRPWALFVSHVSPHPPFTVPGHFHDLYADVDIPLPPMFRPEERPMHPAVAHLRQIMGFQAMTDEAALRRIARCYYALISHLDHEIGRVMDAAKRLSMLGNTRVIYTSDHGEALGAHGLFGKYSQYEPSSGVPLLMAGPELPAGHVVRQPVSHVDLYPTFLSMAGLARQPDEAALFGEDLFPIIAGAARQRPVFGEYHAAGSRRGAFLLRQGDEKLIYHAGWPAQFFDMAKDPEERHDLIDTPSGKARAAVLEALLRRICDPDEVDRRCKEDQRRKAEFWGGNAAILKEGLLVYTPPPGVKAEIAGKPAA